MGHLTFMPRKPTPLGFQAKTLCDGSTGIIINAELVEGKETDRQKEFVNEYGHCTAVTLRMTKPYWGSGRVLIGDSFFGSFKAAVLLKQRGIYMVGNVKN